MLFGTNTMKTHPKITMNSICIVKERVPYRCPAAGAGIAAPAVRYVDWAAPPTQYITVHLRVGETYSLGMIHDYGWTSSDPSIAGVAYVGLELRIVAKSPGAASIKLSPSDINIYYVNVSPAPPNCGADCKTYCGANTICRSLQPQVRRNHQLRQCPPQIV